MPARPRAPRSSPVVAPRSARPTSPRTTRAPPEFEVVSSAHAATLSATPDEIDTIARVLARGEAGREHVDAARRVLAGVGGLRAIARAGRDRLLERGELRAAEADALLAAVALERALRANRAAAIAAPRLRSAESVGHWAVPRLGALEHEEVWVLVFGVRQQMISARRVFQGGVHSVPIHLSSLLREVVADGGTRFVLVHNHPSGDPSPSPEDILVTERVARAGALLGVPLVDHVVVSASAWACVPFRATA